MIAFDGEALGVVPAAAPEAASRALLAGLLGDVVALDDMNEEVKTDETHHTPWPRFKKKSVRVWRF